MSEVPLTLTELKARLGKDMLLFTLDAYGIDNEDTRPAILNAPEDQLIEAANTWRTANAEEMKAVGTVADRALRELPGGKHVALTSIMSDLSKDLYGIQGILGLNARYLGYVFGLLGGQSPDDMEKCLQAIVAYGNGE